MIVLRAHFARRILLPLPFALLTAPSAFATPAVLVNSGHAATYLITDFAILHPELNSAIGLGTIDNTCGTATTAVGCASNQSFDINIIADTQNASLQNVNVYSQQYPVNHAPYVLVNNSFSGYDFSTVGDGGSYTQLLSNGVMASWAFVRSQPAGTPPPITSTTVTATSGPASLSGTNWGLEFGIQNQYMGFDTSAPSWVTAGMTAVLAAMKVDHPTWNWFDIKAALRQTASNWASGWDPAHFGYGTINYTAATSISSSAALYLQPPILQVSVNGNQATVKIYPFRSSRRDHEVVYSVPVGYTFPSNNELTATDITNLVVAGGQLVYTGNATDTIPSGIASFTPQFGGIYNFVAFTTDGAGAYSRVETWSTRTAALPGVSPRQFVQANYQQTECNSCVVVAYAQPQTEGDLNVVVVGWRDSTTHITSVTDTLGNVYSLAAGPTIVPGNFTQAIYYTINSWSADPGGNNVIVTFDGVATTPDVRIAEYSGVRAPAPLDGAVAATGNSATSDSGSLTTTSNGDLLVAADDASVATSGPGAGYTQELLTPIYADILEDEVVTAAATYTATAPLTAAAPWVMQLAAFKAASGSTVKLVQEAYGQSECNNCFVAHYRQPTTGGSLSVVIVGWGDSTTKITSVTDAYGGVYTLAAGPTVVANSVSQAIYYKINNYAPHTSNSVVVTFDGTASTPDVRIAEYIGIATAGPFDGGAVNSGNSAYADSARLPTSNANDLLIAADTAVPNTSAAGSYYTQEQLTPIYADLLEDRVVTASGSYIATAPLVTSGAWIMQLVAFKLAPP